MNKIVDLNATKRSDVVVASTTDGRCNIYTVGSTYSIKSGFRKAKITRWSILDEVIWDYIIETEAFSNFLDVEYISDDCIYALGTTNSEQFIMEFDKNGVVKTCVKFKREHMTVFEAMVCNTARLIYTVGKRFTASDKVIPMLCITTMDQKVTQQWIEIEDSRIETFLDLSMSNDTFHAIGFSGGENIPATMWLSSFDTSGHLLWEREIDPIVSIIHKVICDIEGNVYIVGHNGTDDNNITILDASGIKITDMDIPEDVVHYKHTIAYNPKGIDNQLLLVGSKHKDIVALNVSDMLTVYRSYQS